MTDDDAKRDEWRREVIASAQRMCAELDECGRWLPSSDVVSVVWRDACGRVEVTRGGGVLPPVGSSWRPEAFDAESFGTFNVVHDLHPDVSLAAVCVGRVLVYVWAVAPGGGEAEMLWLHGEAHRADVERGAAEDAADEGPAADPTAPLGEVESVVRDVFARLAASAPLNRRRAAEQRARELAALFNVRVPERPTGAQADAAVESFRAAVEGAPAILVGAGFDVLRDCALLLGADAGVMAALESCREEQERRSRWLADLRALVGAPEAPAPKGGDA